MLKIQFQHPFARSLEAEPWAVFARFLSQPVISSHSSDAFGFSFLCANAARSGGARGGDLPANGPPNGGGSKDYGNGQGQIETYGPNGKAQTDYDFGHDHNGAGDPHAHDWDWSPTPPRQPARPIRPESNAMIPITYGMVSDGRVGRALKRILPLYGGGCRLRHTRHQQRSIAQ